jgi:hypothetical protein
MDRARIGVIMRSKLTMAVGAIVVALLLATNPAVVEAAGLVTSAKIKNNAVKSIDIRQNTITGGDVRNGSLGGGDVTDGSLTGADVLDGGLTASDLAPGTIPAPSAIPTVRWALVNGTHTAILAQSGGISIAGTSGAGTYLNMGSPVAGSALSVTSAYTDTDNGTRGNVTTTICGGAPAGATCALPGTNTTSHVWVFTRNAANSAGENHAFYVSVVG